MVIRSIESLRFESATMTTTFRYLVDDLEIAPISPGIDQ